MKITIDRKRIWPPDGRIGVHWYKFELDLTGSLTYREFTGNRQGGPQDNKETIVVQFERVELERLRRRLAANRASPPRNENVVDASMKLDSERAERRDKSG